MTTLLSRRSYRFVVFSAIITCGWLGVALALSRWVFRAAAPGLLWPELVDLGCLAGAAASLVVFFLADLRLRRNAAGVLAGQSRQLELIADAANAGLWTWDLRTDQIVFSNRWCTQLGYKGADIENHRRTWSRLIHPEDEPRVRAQLDACVAAPPADFSATFRLRHHDGSWRTVLTRGSVLAGADGRPAQMVGVQLDITERQSAEEEQLKLRARLLESQKLESLGLLAGSIAHDFNNLLSGVLSNAELAQLDLPEEGPLPTRIDQIKQAALRMADLSREMLAYSGRGSFNVTHVDLNALVREMSNLLTTGISKRVKLHYEFAPTPVVVEAEATQIRQVLMNLITNASDAMNQRSGVITLTTGMVGARAADFAGVPGTEELRDGFYAFFEVRDTGCGMSPDTINRMFEPFFTTKPHGRGLGLAAVQDIVRGHHGALCIRSTPGSGTTIRVLLPLPADAINPSDATPLRASDWRGSGTVLVVDDEKIIRDTAATLLAHLGFKVVLAADGDEALRSFQRSSQSIRAVLLDATIPGIEGREVVAQLRAARPGLPVLLTSGYSEKEVMQHYSGVPVAGFVGKPFELVALERTLQGLVPEEPNPPARKTETKLEAAWEPKALWADGAA
jgi:PAS domain S-box-containing protein